MAHLEGRWDCVYCDTKGIKGLIQTCPNCGKTRGKDTKFYLGDAPRVLTKAESARVGTAADWYCDSCDSLNPAANAHCKNCGALKGSKNYFNMNKAASSYVESWNSDNHSTKIEYTYDQDKYDFKDDEPAQSKKQYTPRKTQYAIGSNFIQQEYHRERNHGVAELSHGFFGFIGDYFKPIMAVLLILLVIASAVFIFTPKIKEGPVESVRWERNISIQIYKTVQESDWTVPVGGRITSQSREIHHYDQELDHYESKTEYYTERVQTGSHMEYRDNGNGTFTSYSVPDYDNVQKTRTTQVPVYRDVPVYKTKYYYDIDKWVFLRNVTTNGNDANPYWGEYELNTIPGIGQTRVGGQSERYYVTVLVNEKAKEYSMDYDLWKTMNIGQTVKLKVQLGHAELYIEDTNQTR